MLKSGLTNFSRIEHELRSSSHDAFEGLVAELVGGVAPNIAQSRRLGALDRLGIDVHQFDGETDAETMAIQCKGFERAFAEEHVKVCDAEIAKYLQHGPPVRTYWLVVNKRVPEAFRNAIALKMKVLVESGKAKTAELLDLKAFVRRLRQLAGEQLAKWATERRSELKAEFDKRLALVSYIAEVPFTLSEGSLDPLDTGKTPSAWMRWRIEKYLQDIHPEHVGKDRSPPRFLVSGSFGFGKTSLLHALAEDWITGERHAIYVPAALLPEGAFINGAGLTEALLQILTPSDQEFSPLAQLVLRETLRKDVARSKDWLLVIDAMDESPNWAHHEKLAALWGAVADLGLPLVVSVRDELLSLRRGEFDPGPLRSIDGPFFEQVRLLDWSNALIGEFLRRFEKRQQGIVSAQFSRLKQLVDDGGYAATYGDIPKRPLFLGMLAADAWEDIEPERELHRLYEVYLRQKLQGDRFSAGAGGRVVRSGPLARLHGQEESTERMILAMQSLAGMALSQSNSDMSLAADSLFRESQVADCVRKFVGDYTHAEEITLNSLLQPAGRNPTTRERLFRFAHQSFQDWFAARDLVARGIDWTQAPSAVRSFAEMMSESRSQ